ncbi:hypothetical protein [Sphingobacterium suaedae]|uniref:DUF4345 domain-containing protein n=1 Tax=Sphingobacterium suaedae TaxID=1686402 RepID=A0ABW5KHJ1_9SPHI
MNKYVRLVISLVLIAGVGYGAHWAILYVFDLQKFWAQTDYTLSSLYLFGVFASLAVGVLLYLTDFAMPKYLSFVFLGCVLIKSVGSYLFIQAGLNTFENDFLELNFLVTFFIFLLYDVFVAYRLVNQEVKGVEK